MEQGVLWLGGAALAYVLWRLRAGWLAKAESPPLFVLPPAVALELQPLLTDRGLLFYNLIRLAVQDQYLVFARVPLWCVFRVEAERPLRLQVLRRMALRQLDFVLVHPGSRTVEQVVQLEEQGKAEQQTAQREIRAVVQAAGVRLTSLEAEHSYTVQQLAAILGVGDSE
ncbi:MAG TPA: DUF2726 domain-containing protein [Nitrospira sp.]|nr:DUF2726 domain-containing protein [Nitrospira sp.]